MPISQFEVDESLCHAGKLLRLIPNIAQEFTESGGIRAMRYGSYMEYAVWEQVDVLLGSLFENAVFPVDRLTSKFELKLSENVDSLFISPYTDSFKAFEPFITAMNENRRLRFALSTRRFLQMTAKLQVLVAETLLFQQAYSKQVGQLGISDQGLSMAPLKESALKEIIDLHTPKGLVINFSDNARIRDFVFAADFTTLKKLMQFQILQNTILEVALRFHRHLLDPMFFVSYFELDSEESPFVTGDNSPDARVFKQFVASQIFSEYSDLFKDNQVALDEKEHFCLSLREVKSKSRPIL
jgi:hypothetical protein